MQFSSALIQEAVDNLSKLPGIGPKSALRLAIHILQTEPAYAKSLGTALVNMREQTKECRECHNISDDEVCSICSNQGRDRKMICIVENIRDLMAIEDTHQYRGLYHVLGGVISPIEGIGPDDLNLPKLKDRILKEGIEELVMAISPSIDGDTTIFYINRLLEDTSVRISTIARGVSFGGALEYTDEITLGRSIVSRIPYNR
jgi:recombination protein RecR